MNEDELDYGSVRPSVYIIVTVVMLIIAFVVGYKMSDKKSDTVNIEESAKPAAVATNQKPTNVISIKAEPNERTKALIRITEKRAVFKIETSPSNRPPFVSEETVRNIQKTEQVEQLVRKANQ